MMALGFLHSLSELLWVFGLWTGEEMGMQEEVCFVDQREAGQKRDEVRLRRAAWLCARVVKPALREEEEHGPWTQDHFCRKDWGMEGKEGSS